MELTVRFYKNNKIFYFVFILYSNSYNSVYVSFLILILQIKKCHVNIKYKGLNSVEITIRFCKNKIFYFLFILYGNSYNNVYKSVIYRCLILILQVKKDHVNI